MNKVKGLCSFEDRVNHRGAMMPFASREHAARLLAEKLEPYRGQNPLVLAIPRGGVPMAELIAEHLAGELDIVLVHKLGAPGNPEFAVGAVDEAGEILRSQAIEEYGISESYIQEEAKRELATIRERRRRYTPARSPLDPTGRVTIVVDDGVATGSTLLAALRSLRSYNPVRLIAAVGVAPPDAARRLAEEADELVLLETPRAFMAVGEFFYDFRQVDDEEVIRILSASNRQQ